MSDQSLRDALEKLPSTWDAVPMHVVRELLAAHPVEPARANWPAKMHEPIGGPSWPEERALYGEYEPGALEPKPAEPAGVSDEARAAGLAALHADNDWHKSDGGGVWRANYKRAVDLVLEAAQPFMQPQVVASRGATENECGAIRRPWSICLLPAGHEGDHAWTYKADLPETLAALLPPTEAQIAEAIDQHYEEDAYLPVYNEAGDLVSSAAAVAVLNLLGGTAE